MTWVDKWAGKHKAKSCCFRQQISPPENKFELNYVLEAADLRVAIQDSPGDRTSVYTNSTNTRRHRSVSFSLAKVVEKQGSRICLRHLGTDDRNDIWLMIDSEMIRPYPSGLELSVPFGFMNSHSVWNKIIMKVDKEEKLALKEWFPNHPKDPGYNQFNIGEKVEAVDRRNAQLICPATISDINGNFVLVSFDGWSGTFDYWAAYNSQDLFPVGWCSKSKHKLQQPGPHFELGKLKSEYNDEYSVPAQIPKPIKRRQTTEVQATKKKSLKTTEKPILSPQDMSTVNSADYDSDCTHLCFNDEDSRMKKLKLNNSSKVIHDTLTMSKSKSFSNLLKLWTEKNAQQTKQDNLNEENEKSELSNNSDKEVKMSIKEEKENNADTDMSTSYKVMSFEKFSDATPTTNSDPLNVPCEQLNSTKPPSPSVNNSPITNSLLGDCKYLSETSGVSCCAKSEEICSSMISPYDTPTKRVSSMTNLPSDPSHWTIDDVLVYLINKNPTLDSIAQEFKNHEIDGQALLLLNMNTLRQYMKIKLGPAIKVEHIIKNLLDGKI